VNSERLLCATDGSAVSEKAVIYTIGLALKTGQAVTLLLVADGDVEAQPLVWDEDKLKAGELPPDKELLAALQLALKHDLLRLRLVHDSGEDAVLPRPDRLVVAGMRPPGPGERRDQRGADRSRNCPLASRPVAPVGQPTKRPVADPEDDGDDVLAFADFMAATRAPGRQNPIPAAATRGDSLFTAIGCAVCHTRTFQTAAPGTLINGGAFAVPAALGNKIIHPFSDFALHDIGTGDGIVQNAGQGSANQMRTAPLWGIRARNRFLHQGLNVTIFDVIQLHAGQATAARNNFNNALTAAQRNDLIAFVLSL